MTKRTWLDRAGGLLTSVGEEVSNSIRGLDAGIGAVEAMDKPAPNEEEQKAEDLAEDESGVADDETQEELAAEGARADEGAQEATEESAQTYVGVGETETTASQAQVQLASYAGISGASRPIWESAAQEDTRPESFQTVEDGYYGPPPPHDFDQSGCGCVGCCDPDGSGGLASGGVGVPAAATSLDTIARYLSEYNHTGGGDDFWDEFWGSLTPEGWAPNFHWNLGSTGLYAKNGTLTYNVSGNWYDSDGITDDGLDSTTKINAIRHALNVYEDILGINFVEVTTTGTSTGGGVDIAFGNEVTTNTGGPRAFANFNADGKTTDGNATGNIQNAWINISKNWSGDGTIGDYYFLTARHEIGHTLGLGHSGLYNAGSGSPTYNDSYWENDTRQFTMMSYWAQSNYTAPGQNTPSNVNSISPLAVDWLALDRMYNPFGYGIDDGITASDTVWGFNSTWYDWTPSSSGPGYGYANTAFASLEDLLDTNGAAIIDGGGNDTLDLSGFSNNTKIDVSEVLSTHTQPSFSDVAGLTGNLQIGVARSSKT